MPVRMTTVKPNCQKWTLKAALEHFDRIVEELGADADTVE
jgi:hypothetical protein